MTNFATLKHHVLHSPDHDERVNCQLEIDNTLLKDQSLLSEVTCIYTQPYLWIDVIDGKHINFAEYDMLLPYGVWDILIKRGTAAEIYAIFALRKG